MDALIIKVISISLNPSSPTESSGRSGGLTVLFYLQPKIVRFSTYYDDFLDRLISKRAFLKKREQLTHQTHPRSLFSISLQEMAENLSGIRYRYECADILINSGRSLMATHCRPEVIKPSS